MFESQANLPDAPIDRQKNDGHAFTKSAAWAAAAKIANRFRPYVRRSASDDLDREMVHGTIRQSIISKGSHLSTGTWRIVTAYGGRPTGCSANDPIVGLCITPKKSCLPAR